MIKSFFVSDLHGKELRYMSLFKTIEKQRPELVFIGGDLLSSINSKEKSKNFIEDFLFLNLEKLKSRMGSQFPLILIIMGNDDPRSEEPKILKGEEAGYWKYLHKKKINYKGYEFLGYAHVPPTPFLLKDWERYDVSRYVDVGAVDPLAGYRTKEIPREVIEYYTIAKDLELISKGKDLSKSVCLFHTPPYKSKLDRAALDGKMFNHAPLDVHVGSIAVKRFIEQKQPYLTLHGHVHESSSITGFWNDKIGVTNMFSAAWDKDGLALVIFDLENLHNAERIIVASRSL